jgi:hypothetical protein
MASEAEDLRGIVEFPLTLKSFYGICKLGSLGGLGFRSGLLDIFPPLNLPS